LIDLINCGLVSITLNRFNVPVRETEADRLEQAKELI